MKRLVSEKEGQPQLYSLTKNDGSDDIVIFLCDKSNEWLAIVTIVIIKRLDT